MEQIFSTLINGLSLGGIYAMIALGYTMVYGIAKLLNFAHGDIIMVGGYVIFVCMVTNNPLLAVLMAVICCVALGVFIEKVAYKPLRGASPLAVLITAIGVSYLLQSLAQIIFGSAPKMVTVYDFGAIQLFGATIQISALVTLGVAAIVMVALTLFVKYSRLGRMAGGAWEYVMGYTTGSTIGVGGSSGITSLYSTFFTDSSYNKYYDKYSSTEVTNYNNRILGDATGELGPFYSNTEYGGIVLKSSWYDDYARFVNSSEPWFVYGAAWRYGYSAGIFAFSYAYGNSTSANSFRIVLAPTK